MKILNLLAIRKYLEQTLKNICLNLEVKLSFKYNDINEKRMPSEMLSELKSKISKYITLLKAEMLIINRLIDSSIFGNLLSHDNPFNPKKGDLVSFWNDNLEFENLFLCHSPQC